MSDEQRQTYEDSWARGMLSEVVGDRSAPDLSAQIMARAEREGGSRSPRASWLAAGLVLLGVAIVFALTVGPLGGSDPTSARDAKTDDPNADDSVQDPVFEPQLSLALGTTWTYEVVGRDGSQTIVDKVTAHRRVRDRLVAQVERTSGGVGYRYLSEDARGVLEYPGRNFFNAPGLGQGEPARVVRLPLTATSKWTYEMFAKRSIARAKGLPGGDRMWNGGPPLLRRDVAVVALDVEVEIGERAYRAAHLRETGRQEGVEVVTDIHWVAGIGAVQQVRKHDGVEVERVQLESFEVGRDSETPAARLPMLLAKHKELGALGMPDKMEWVDLGAAEWVLFSDFCVATWGDDVRILRILGEQMSVFDPEAPKSWNEMLTWELVSRHNAVTTATLLIAVSETYGRLLAAREGRAVVGFHTLSIQVGPGTNTHRGSLRVDQGGTTAAWTTRVDRTDGQIHKLDLTRGK